MAYLDLCVGAPSFAGRIAEPAVTRRLSAQERLVVLLSRTDPLWSLRPRHTHSRLLNLLFGIEAPHHLADPRLEALRNYAVTYRLRDAGVAVAEQGALEADFSATQLGQVRHMIDGARAIVPRRNVAATIRHAVLMLAALLIGYGAIAWLSPRFDSVSIAFVFVAVTALSFAPFAGRTTARA